MPRQKSQHVDDPRAVGERLKAARTRAGLSQRQLSFPGCSPAYISRIEAGERIPSLQLLRELGGRLGVSEDFLATGAERRLSEPPLIEAELALRLDDVDLAAELYQTALNTTTNAPTRADALEGLGHVALRRDEPRRAITLFEQALAVSGQDGSARPALAEALGRAHALLGHLEPAASIFERCLETFRARGDKPQSVRFAVLLGYALIDSGDFARAEEVIAAALEDGRTLDDPVARARLYWSQYKLRLEQGDTEEALRYGQLALATIEATEYTWFIARAHQGLAHVQLDRGHVEEALDHLRAGWPLIDESGTPVEKAYFRIEEARALARLGEREKAAALAMQIAGTLGEALPEDVGRTHALLGEIFGELGEPERARELYELAEETLEPLAPTRYLADVYAKHADLLEADGRRDEAFALVKKAYAIERSLGPRATVQRM